MGLSGFYCKTCGKAFYATIDDPECIADDIKSIRKYQKQGFKFKKIRDKKDMWCECNWKKKE